MSDWAVHLVTAGSLPMRDGLMAPRGELGDIEVVSNVLLTIPVYALCRRVLGPPPSTERAREVQLLA